MTVSFPALGLEFNINRVAFEIGRVSIYWYGIIIAAGLLVGIVMASYAAKKVGEKTDIPLDLALICGPVAIVFARLYYVLFKLDFYIENPMEIFNLRGGGIAIYGAIIGAVLAAAVYCKIKKYKTLSVFDIGSVGLITGQMIGRWGNFFNQEAFGDNTSLPWGMFSQNTASHLYDLKLQGIDVNPDLPVHPTFLYESLWSLGVLITLFLLIRNYRFSGQIFFAYGALYGLGRLWIEGLRTDSLMLGTIRISQFVAFLSVIVFGCMYFYYYKKNITESKNIMQNTD